MSERNWEKDWELCQKASPSLWRVVGKDSWKLKGFPQVEINTPEGHYFPVNFECDAIFIAEARDALPYWLQRVRKLEQVAEAAKRKRNLEIERMKVIRKLANHEISREFWLENTARYESELAKAEKELDKALAALGDKEETE